MRELPSEVPDLTGSESSLHMQQESLNGLAGFSNVRLMMTDSSATSLPPLDLISGLSAQSAGASEDLTRMAGKTNRHGGGTERDAYLDRLYG
jgi:hypothetical protein